MEPNNNQNDNTYTTEAICTNCKGKGTSTWIRMKVRLRGLVFFLVGLWFMNFYPGSFYSTLGMFCMLFGAIETFRSSIAKCSVCKGTGKVSLTVEKH